MARHCGARHIVITDVNDYRLELARRMGASRALNVTSESLDDAMRSLGMEEGFDVGFEMSGNPAALREMLRTMNNGGSISLLKYFKNAFIIFRIKGHGHCQCQ